jgi:antibiotic biosynthesis monooxygenase (ABM) superfamily enzyme
MENVLSNLNSSVRRLLLSRAEDVQAQQKSTMAPQSRRLSPPQSPTSPSRVRRSALLSMVVILVVCLAISPAGESSKTTAAVLRVRGGSKPMGSMGAETPLSALCDDGEERVKLV